MPKAYSQVGSWTPQDIEAYTSILKSHVFRITPTLDTVPTKDPPEEGLSPERLIVMDTL